MADWSQLPNDLLQKICQKLNNSELYLLCFRSVCSSWRRASVQNWHHNHLPSKLPQFPHFFEINCVHRFSKQNIFLIKPPATITQQQTLRPWLIRIGPDIDGKPQIWHPFDVQLNDVLYAAPYYFDRLLIDFNQIPVIHLGHMFYIHGLSFLNEKVVAATCEMGQPLSVLTYNDDVLKIFRSEDNYWTSIPTMPMRSSWPGEGDICFFKGRLCVADKNGRTLMIGENLGVFLLAKAVFGGNVKFLVESECDLLLVDCYGIDTSSYDKDIRFDVFKLDEKEKKWVRLTTLGDRVLFVGVQCSFSASASDLHVAYGNCIIYSRNSIFKNLNDIQSGLRIFHLDQGQVSRLSDYPDYIKLFWPPPKWIIGLHNSDEFNLSEVTESDNERTNYDDDKDDYDYDDDDDD